MDHLFDNFWFGIGIGNFSLYYPEWQIDYISSAKSLPELFFMNAEETFVAFNEYLQIFIEVGFIGFIFFLYLCFRALSKKAKQASVHFLKVSILLILVSCISSYSLHCNVVFFIFTYCIAALSAVDSECQKHLILKNKLTGQTLYFIILGTFFLVLFKSTKTALAVNQWNQVRNNLFLTAADVRIKYDQLQPALQSNGKFLLDWGEHLLNINENVHAVKVLERSKKSYLSYRTYISTATAHYEVGNISGAIVNLEKISNLIPAKFLPKYNLVKLYGESGDSLKANQMAKQILTMPVKKVTADVIKIKEEMQKLSIQK